MDFVNFINIDKFEEWIKENIKGKFYDIEPYLEDVYQQICECSCSSYELSAFESKTGCPVLYSVEVDRVEVDEDEWEINIFF